MTGIVTLAATAVASLGMSAYEMSQSSSEQSTANQIASTELGMAQTTQGEQEYYNNLLQQLIANPSSVAQLPGYQFELSQGSAAVAAGMGAQGYGGSGNLGAALEQFGTGLASSFYGQQTQLLSALSGVTSASSPSSSASAASGAVSAGTQSTALSTQTLSNLLNSLGFYGTLLGKLGSNTGAASGTPAQLAAGGFGPMGGDTVYGGGS